MIGITENRLTVNDITFVLNISRDVYDLAVAAGVLAKGDISDSTTRHSFSDLMMLSVVLVHGWPVIPIYVCADDAEIVHDLISYSWEKCFEDKSLVLSDVMSHRPRTHDAAYMFSDLVFHEISIYNYISESRKKALMKYMNSIISLAHILYIKDSNAKRDESGENTVQSLRSESSQLYRAPAR